MRSKLRNELGEDRKPVRREEVEKRTLGWDTL